MKHLDVVDAKLDSTLGARPRLRISSRLGEEASASVNTHWRRKCEHPLGEEASAPTQAARAPWHIPYVQGRTSGVGAGHVACARIALRVQQSVRSPRHRSLLLIDARERRGAASDGESRAARRSQLTELTRSVLTPDRTGRTTVTSLLVSSHRALGRSAMGAPGQLYIILYYPLYYILRSYIYILRRLRTGCPNDET